MSRPRPCYYSSLTCHPADEIRSLARTHDNVITLYLFLHIILHCITHTCEMCIRNGSYVRRNVVMIIITTVDTLILICECATRQRNSSGVNACTVRLCGFFYSSEFPLANRWRTAVFGERSTTYNIFFISRPLAHLSHSSVNNICIINCRRVMFTRRVHIKYYYYV